MRKSSTSPAYLSKKLFRVFAIILSLALESNARMHHQPSSSSSLSATTSKEKNHPLTLISNIAPILGESAIIDKETSQVYWQGGRQSLFQSTVGHSYLSNQDGIARHVRATLLSCILWISFIRHLASWMLKQRFLLSSEVVQKKVTTSGVWLVSKKTRDVLLGLTRIMLLIVTFLPKFNPTFIMGIIVLYLLESYTCSTRRFLDNALSIPDELEEYMEAMREEKPQVKWEIRCFHYEKRIWLTTLLCIDLWAWFKSKLQKTTIGNDGDSITTGGTVDNCKPSIFSRKVVTNKKNEYYQFDGWEDQTVAGLLKQARGTTVLAAPFTKISFSKVLLFSDVKTRRDFFAQQSDFIKRERHKDTCAEFSTNIDVTGFKPKLLAIRPIHSLAMPSTTKLLRIHNFWIFTLLGLTVPFRIRLARHCDELKVALVKETSGGVQEEEEKSFSFKSWFQGPTSASSSGSNSNSVRSKKEKVQEKHFRTRMEEISLYEKEKAIEQKKDLLKIEDEENDESEQTPSLVQNVTTSTSDNPNTNSTHVDKIDDSLVTNTTQ